MDITLLVSLLAFVGLVASWIMLPTGAPATETTATTTAVASTSKA